MDDSALLQHLKEYHDPENSQNFDVLDYIGAFGSPLLAIAYSRLFWPRFSELEGMVFLEDAVKSDDAKRRLEKCLRESRTKREIEESFNLFEIPSYFFNKNAGDTSDSEDEYLATILVQTWRAKLVADFPQRRFLVENVSAEEMDGEIAVCFYEE